MTNFLLDDGSAIKLEVISFDEPFDGEGGLPVMGPAPPTPLAQGPPPQLLGTPLAGGVDSSNGDGLGWPSDLPLLAQGHSAPFTLSAAARLSSSSSRNEVGGGGSDDFDDELGMPPDLPPPTGFTGVASAVLLGGGLGGARPLPELAPLAAAAVLESSVGVHDSGAASAPTPSLPVPWDCVETAAVVWDEGAGGDQLVRANEYYVVGDLGSGSFGRVFEVSARACTPPSLPRKPPRLEYHEITTSTASLKHPCGV